VVGPGDVLTVLLWGVAVAAHLGYNDLIAGGRRGGAAFGNATVLLHLAVTLTVQRLIVQARAGRAKRPGGRVPNGSGEQ
jgi:hypothetical protein